MSDILIVTPRLPYPVIGGDRLRIYKIAERLARDHRLTLLSLTGSDEETRMQLPDDGVFDTVERVTLPRHRSVLNCIRALPTGRALQIAYYESAEFAARVRELGARADLALFHLVRTAPYADALDVPCMLEATDAISLNYRRVASSADGAGLRRWIYTVEQPRIEAFERRTLPRFAACSFVSEIDRRYVADAIETETRLFVAGNGVDADRYRFAFREGRGAGPRTLVFIGNMASFQNLDAASWFAEKVLPELNRDGTRYRFKVIGRIADADARSLRRQPDVEVTGAVDAVATHAADGIAGICSVRLGAGVQNKNLEYMALGLPCVTSAVGAEGLDAEDGVHLRVADTVAQWCDAIRRIDEDVELARTMATQARSLIETRYSWDTQLAPLVHEVAALTAQAKR